MAVTLVATVIATLFVGVSWGASYSPDTDPYSLANVTLATGAQAWWNAGYTGKGVDIALIDSGVTPVAGLNGQGKLANGPDLSLDSQNPGLRYLDAFGHGTFMAGLIAGKDSTYRGMAPDARLVSVKVGAADGAVDVSQVIAAIDWVVQHAHDPGFNIRVINLSYGTNSLQDPSLDPLAFAAEQAWKRGILVVAAGGNYGFQTQRNAPALADPAYDSSLLAVGSIDTNGTLVTSDDQVPSFSPWPKRGATRGVDLVTPGTHLQGLRVPNSFIDVNHPEGYLDDRYFRGSGTSQSAALVSGAAALVLQRYPDATPDQVKQLLMGTATYLRDQKSQAQGGGELNLTAALAAPLPSASSALLDDRGTGSLEQARGSDHLTAPDGTVLSGEQDIFGKPFDSAAMAALEASASSWSGGMWNASTWSGSSWSGLNWLASSWSASSWSASSWSASSWSASSWSGSSWSASSWSGSSWSGSSWSGGGWQGATWG
ncbi:MAG TPA: S8 family serine peptidase [Gaiellaceae bacterium]|nr:S8 family serine peptidase [Gaiellaceae bacterium]